jgi:two-component system, cell cycle response regulator
MKLDKKEHSISKFCEFTDKNLEKEFFEFDMGQAIRYIRPVGMVLGILYMLFIIPDYFLIKNSKIFIAILINRSAFLLLVIFLFFTIKKLKSYKVLAYWITVYESVGIISFLVIFGQYETPDFLIQAFGVMVIILGIFLVPNKWVNTLATSLIVSTTFFMLSVYFIKEIKFAEYSAGIAYIFMVLILSSIASFCSSYYKRKQFIYSKELLKLSITDSLTGIYNRAKLDEELKRWIEYSERHKTPLSLVLFDFDNFKEINDTYGHMIGDKVIIETVNIIKSSIRQTDMFARWGGEEFVLLLTNTDMQQALELTEKLRELVSNNVYENVKNVTCSFGLVICKENDNADTLLNRVDKLLYIAKTAGKNKVVS